MKDAQNNQLIAALPDDVYSHWLGQWETVEMPLGDVLHASGRSISHVYFPTTSIVSLLHTLESGASAEVAVVGNEGIVGISSFMGGSSTPYQSVVRSAGSGLRLPVSALMRAFEQVGPVAQLLLRYTQALITQVSQIAVCNRHHSVDQQLCRWLLFNLDRLRSNEMWTTQELIANMLGVRREGVTEAAGRLQKEGVIRYARGRITVMDRPALERRSCECYLVVKVEYGRPLQGQQAFEP
ncbi:Crp/Fnr family transcriptional regulator [Acidovorax sp. A1169]|uniref:Crp/Fnr family transcriptional regulator n=1 Tax=Acidovorax sp. A1169 TaxID=3059524 RepID=UPI002737BBED|nr:Crp/Fnr family transcriptional regulator [Acidovorax sp. A1169]MDP4078199.1 Crp/Fnr family transcriptional regulator [Acidovorax sp. A1169]